MDLPSDLRHLFCQWLDEDASASNSRGSRMGLVLARASDHLKLHQGPIGDNRDLLKVRGIGPKLAQRLVKRLHRYCIENGVEDVPWWVAGELQDQRLAAPVSNADVLVELDEPEPAPKRRRVRQYVPAPRSGGYAVLLVLLVQDRFHTGMLKEEVVRHAGRFSDKLFEPNPGTKEFYLAWSCVKTLLKHDLVFASGRPVRYALTEEGAVLARTLEQVARDNGELPDAPLVGAVPEKTGDETSTWLPSDYTVQVVVDNREIRGSTQRDFFTRKLTELGVVCADPCNLAVGDVVWVASHRTLQERCVLDYIVERKRLDDLASSIRDGRFGEQKARLARTGIRNCIYLVEELAGVDTSDSAGLRTAISQTITALKFHVERCANADVAARYLARLTRAICKQYAGQSIVVVRPQNLAHQQEYGEVLETTRRRFPGLRCGYNFDVFQLMMLKRDLMTVRELFVRMLMTIRGVLVDKALAVQQHFGTPRQLLEFYHTTHAAAGEDEKRRLLSMVLGDQPGARKIGPALLARIYDVWGRQSYV